ncbi:putative anti-sigma factor [Escherichia phage vB_EcoM_ESCO47]|nr:putative anti-sigma factor [Escherichia phage vB_EcoM_ESCO47]
MKLSNIQIKKIERRLDHTRASAKRRSKDFNLDFNYLKNILDQKVCAYSGETFDNKVEGEKLSLERFNNDIGYIKGNVIPVKKKYNAARSDFTLAELIEKREIIAGRIATPSAKKVEKLNLDEKKWAEIKHTYTQIKNIQNKRKSRIDHIEKMTKGKSTLSKEDQLKVVGLKARIDGSRVAEGREVTKLNVLLKGSDWKTKTKLSDAETLFDTYDKVIQGLQRFEKIGFIGKLKLKRGLPLNTSIFKLIKG